MSITSIEDNYKKYYQQFTPQMDSEIADIKAVYDAQKTTVGNMYQNEIDNTQTEYDDSLRQNAVQKLVNERQIAENMANLGLTDSGLNRTQQTAAQLSYANNKSSIERQRQQAVDALTLEMNSALTSIETNRATDVAGIKDKYQQNAWALAESQYNTDKAAETELAKEAIKAASSGASDILTYKYASTDDNNNKIYYGSDGKKYTFAEGVNPYTGTNNLIGNTDTAKAGKAYSFFTNGYQPKGVYYNGEDCGPIKRSGDTAVINGVTQNVWATDDGRYWVWDGSQNKYLPYDSGKVEIKPTSTSKVNSFISSTYTQQEYLRRGKTLSEWKTYIEGILNARQNDFTDGELLYLIQHYGLS